MNQDSKDKLKLSKGVSRAFENFLIQTNLPHGGQINNLTWEALYSFIKYTHSFNVRLGDDQLRDMLLYSGAKLEDAEKLAMVYLHGRNLLYKKKLMILEKCMAG
jgi:hypothetical protein